MIQKGDVLWYEYNRDGKYTGKHEKGICVAQTDELDHECYVWYLVLGVDKKTNSTSTPCPVEWMTVIGNVRDLGVEL